MKKPSIISDAAVTNADPADYFAERAKRADLDVFDRIMARKTEATPLKGDELP